MSNKEDWEEIESYIKKKESENKKKYKVDIDENFAEKLHRTGKRIRITELSIIFLLIFFLLFCANSVYQHKYSMQRKYDICNGLYYENIEEFKICSDLFGNGMYKYRIKNISEIEFHSLFIKNKNIAYKDVSDRINKYFFEKWNNPIKNMFATNETYENCKFGLVSINDYFLRYETFIEINTYEELLKATEAIIEYSQFINIPQILTKNYILFNNKLIYPRNSTTYSSKDIMESAIRQYNDILNNNAI